MPRARLGRGRLRQRAADVSCHPFTAGPTWALVAASAAVFWSSGLAGGARATQRQRHLHVQDMPVSALVDDSAHAYPLDDSDLSVSATGVLFAEPQGHKVFLVANGLPGLPRVERYQVWLFTSRRPARECRAADRWGRRRPAGVSPDTCSLYRLCRGRPHRRAEQREAPSPTSDLVLGGSFPPAIAALPSLPA